MRHRNAKSPFVTRILSMVGLTVILGGFLGSTISSDETVIIFPSYATQTSDGKNWKIKVHAWVFELESSSFFRSGILKTFAHRLEATDSESSSETFKTRARYFIADNERGKDLSILIADTPFTLPPTGANGHTATTITLPIEVVNRYAELRPHSHKRTLTGTALLDRTPGRIQRFDIHLIEPTGISVISDIDDTIKVSDVISRRSLLKNTFINDYKPVSGMDGVYTRWSSQGAMFHYVSASPWQLYAPLLEFFTQYKFPLQSIAMKGFRWKDSSFFDLFAENGSYKLPLIEELITEVPNRKFYLIGDTGERDLHLYCTVADKHPEKVKGIFIRKTPGAEFDENAVNKECPAESRRLVQFFDSPTELPEELG